MLSLALQGGPMSATEVASFEAMPWSREAVRLRRYDEAAKDAQALTEPVTHFLRHIGVCLRG